MDNFSPNGTTKAQVWSKVLRFFNLDNERGELAIPFIESVAEESREAVTEYITNTGLSNEEIAKFDSFDNFLKGHGGIVKDKLTAAEVRAKELEDKVKSSDAIGALSEDQKAVMTTKGWKTIGDAITSYSELEKLVGHEKIAMPKVDKEGNYLPGEFERVMKQLGLPGTANEYKVAQDFKLPEGIHLKPELMTAFNEKAHKAGLLPSQYQFVMGELANIINQGTVDQKEKNIKDFNEAMLNLRTIWGSEYDHKVKLANNVLRLFTDNTAEGELLVSKYGTNPEIIKLLGTVGSQLSEEAISRTGMHGAFLSPASAQSEIKRIQAMPAYFDKMHTEHSYWVDRVLQLNRMITAGEKQ
uniref:Putative capsid assembly protein n=1 Tax=viral metagenome TaxID=1070528 RepID=A0A6M3LLM7_9ZZZZ